MIKVLKHHVCLCALTTSVFFFITNINAGAQDSKPSCSSLLNSHKCDDLGKIENTDVARPDIAGVTVIKGFSPASIKVGEKALNIDGILKLKKAGTITSDVFSPKKTKVVLESGSITSSGKNTHNSKKVSGRNNGVNQAIFGVEQGGALLVRDNTVNVSNVYGLVAESAPAFSLLEQKEKGSQGMSGKSDIVFESSDITLKGHGVRGLYFLGGLSEDKYTEGEALFPLGEVLFKKSSLKVPNGTAIYADDIRRSSYITAIEGSRIFANRLLEIKNNSYASVLADASFLTGSTHIDKSSYAELNLFNKSQWTVTPRKSNNRKNVQSTVSSVSFVRNVNSSIFFQKPKDGHYQTLQIGADDLVSDYAYVASNARLIVNASFATDGQKKEIKADKLVVYGDVYGKTKVQVVEISAATAQGKGRSQGEQKESPSVSIIQVYGKAEADSFKLATDYVALRGAPYRYNLRAYGPNSSHRQEKDKNKLAKEKNIYNGDFWDFRLEAEYVQRSPRSAQLKASRLKGQVSHSRISRSIRSHAHHNDVFAGHDGSVFYFDEGVKAVVPQVPTYLLLPNALFHAGLVDISNQNKQLETLRAAVGSLLENSENPAFFVRGYGGHNHYVSDLPELQYGYGGNLGYHAVEAGFLLKEIESADRNTSFGIIGTYGKISLQPQDVIESKKSAFDKWSVTAYGSMQSDSGFYLDGLFSYGLFKGDVLTLKRGKTATLKGNSLNASLVSGKRFMTGYEGLVFDPQIQIVYQNLLFDKASDVDGFDIEIGKLNQWVMRAGGRLSKTLPASQTGNIVSFSGKLHLAHSFAGKQFVHFGDKFQLGAFGSLLEAGIGFNAQLSSNFALHGDVTYQHKISKAGFSGTRFAGGLRYRF